MNNKERYRQAFGSVRAPEGLADSIMERIEQNKKEVTDMKKTSKATKRIIAVLAAAMVLILGAGTCYAANVGGIQRAVQLWIHGDQTDAVLTIDTPDPNGPNSYTVSYTDADGNVHEMGGGGIAVDMFGRERPLTEEEIMENLAMPDIYFNDDGTVWVYSLDQKIEVTDMFDEEGYCYVSVKQGKTTYYVTVRNDGSASINTSRYTLPSEWSN